MFTRGDRRGDRSRDRSPRRSPRVNIVYDYLTAYCFSLPSTKYVACYKLNTSDSIYAKVCTMSTQRNDARTYTCVSYNLLLGLGLDLYGVLYHHDSLAVDIRDLYPSSIFVFWATVCKTVRPMLSDRCLSVSPVCLSATLVYCGQTVGWTRMPLDAKATLC